MTEAVAIKVEAIANVGYYCPACSKHMCMKWKSGEMWCSGDSPHEPECPQMGVKFRIPRVELELV